MFLKIEDRHFKDRIYRDVRLIVVFPAIIGIWFMAIAVFNPEGTNGSAIEVFLMGLFVPLGIWFIAKSMLHGSITLNNSSGILEFSESWNLKKPSLTVRKDDIQQVTMNRYTSGASFPGGGRGVYKLVLHYMENRSYKKKVLTITIQDYDDAVRAGQLIGKFCNKPIYDHDEKQIYSPK